MKKYCVLIILFTLLGTNAFAQSAKEFRRWKFGAMLGPQLSMSVPKTTDSDRTGGIMVAADLSYALQNSSKGWSLHLQPGINRFKSKQVNGEQGSDYYMKWNWKSTYINLPLLVRYTILEGKIRPFAEIGTSYLFRYYWKVKGSGQVCANGTCSSSEFDDKGNSQLEKGRFSGLGGIGAEFDLGKVTIPVTVRWIEQLKKIERFNDPFSGQSYTIPRSRGIMVSVGVIF
jgi:hypothetical protein